MKKILVLLATGFEEIEALSVVNVLRRANVSCDMGTLDSDYVKGTHNIEVKSDVNINNIDIDEYDGVVLPGGLPGAYNLRDSKKVREIVQKLNNDKKIIGAICAAPEALESFDILNGKKCTSYPGFIQDKNNVEYIENDIVVEDENIITSRGPATAIEFALEILRKLGYEKEYKEIKEGMLVNFYNEFK
ncbi:DJ-1 family glyoxalase III [Paraclostridium ghonii]|uniref:DJ-1 family glyoxalase III n=1 Tax=Paraclostridium ghonii TaxID=29358 RepID=UPI00202CBF19|nr:DJ-1 family glyoxalase III [Paeniclostridium ghonii]MCM0167351.1 DJ-1/PfpI family protein [Paeniclostridium ghonii]